MVKSVQLGSGEWISEPVGNMDSSHGQSSWIPTSDGRKRFHLDIPVKSSSTIVHSEQVSNMVGEPPLHDLLPSSLTGGGWNDQMLGDVVLVSAQSQPFEVKGRHVTNHPEILTRSEDLSTAVVDRPSSMYMENDVSSFAARLLLTDENSNEDGNMGQRKFTNEVSNDFSLLNSWDPRRSMADYPNEKVLRNQEPLNTAETSQSLWSTPYSPVAIEKGCSFSSARSVPSEDRQSEIEVKMDQSSPGEVPNLLPDRNGHMQGIREAVSSLGGHGVQIVEINQRKAFAEQSQLPGFNRRIGLLDTKSPILSSISLLGDDRGQSATFLSEGGMLTTETQNHPIPFQNGIGLNNFSGRSMETLSPPLAVAVSAVQPEELSLQVPTASPLSMLPTATKCNLFGGSNQSSQVPHVPIHLTPPQPIEQMVGVQQSFGISSPIQSGCLPTRSTFQENLRSKLVSDIGQGRETQLPKSSWQQLINGLDQDSVYKQQQQSLSQGSPPDLDIHGGSFDGPGVPSEWTPNEALVIQQLQATMLQLDVGTRMCIRDALYRLAKSAKERRSCRAHNTNQDLVEPDNATVSSSITGDGTCDGSRGESEKQTNHVDRSIASLLFNTGPFRRYGQPPAYKVRSVSQPLPGVQSSPWLWPSTEIMCNNWASSSGNYVESFGVAPKIPSGNPLNSTWPALPLANGVKAPNETAIDSRMDHDSYIRIEKAVSPDNFQPLEMHGDKLNMPLSSTMRSCALVSANEAMTFDRSAAPSQSSMIPEGMRQEGSTRGQKQRELDPDRDQTFASGPSLVNINYQSALMPFREDVGNEVAAIALSLQEKNRSENRFYDGGGNIELKFSLESVSSQFTQPDEYARMTARNGGHMFGIDVNNIRVPYRNHPSGKEEYDIEELWRN